MIVPEVKFRQAAVEVLFSTVLIHALHAALGAKYYGRVLADVTTPDGSGVSERLLDSNLVRPYGGGRRAGWCG